MENTKNRHRSAKKIKPYVRISVIFVIICSCVCLFSFQYYKSLHKTIREESKGYLQEVSKRVGSNIDRIIQDNFAMLNLMAQSINKTNPKTMEDMQKLLLSQQEYGEFENILLVDSKGKAFNINDNNTVFFSFDDSMREGMANDKKALGTTQVVNNKEYFVFAVAINNVTVEGEKIMALAACYNPDTLDKVLSMTSFNNKAYSQIITKSGTIVTKSNSSFAINSGYNIFSTLQNAQISGVGLESVRKDINNDMAGQIDFSLDGEHIYMVYTPIQPDEWYLLTYVPFKAVNEKSDMLLKITLMICGLIVVTFGGLVSALLYVFSANKRRLERLAYVDEVTGGNTIQKFYEQASKILDSYPGTKYALVYSNIENFKVLNSELGRQNCDLILKHFNDYAVSTLSKQECMGRLFADNFCILMQYIDEHSMLKRFEDWADGAEKYISQLKVSWSVPSTEFGVYVIENTEMPFTEMIDRAKLALKEYPRVISSKMHYSFYDDKARWQLFREKQLADMMEESLANGEFQLYLQPKYKLPEERINGAEALVRWQSKSEGMIYPNEFIPLFEKNGFIVQLDLWMFEKVCKTISSWIERGLDPIKVSVNCSRVHLKNEEFLKPYLKIVDKYKLDRQWIEIELTESIVFEDTEQLTKVINEIKAAGFGCSMDDFGSGYSSLNLIQSIPVDTLKIDKVFFQKSTMEFERMEAVVGSIVQMAHSLSMVTVAEGVEYREQVDMLQHVGCDYVQGFIFDKPMSVESFEKRAFGTKLPGGEE